MNQHKAIVLAALRDYEYKLDAHYDGQPEAMAERDAARAALAWVQTWGEATPTTCFVVMEWHDGVARSPIAAYGTREQAAERADAFRDIVELPWESAPAPQQPDQPAQSIVADIRERWGHNAPYIGDQYFMSGKPKLYAIAQRDVWALCQVIDQIYRTPAPQQPAMPQAEWSQAPEWAMWWAVDANLCAYWYGAKPGISFGTWEIIGGEYDKYDRDVDLPLGIDWRTTLQARPTAQEVSGEVNEESD